MVKKVGGKRRGIPRGVAGHKIKPGQASQSAKSTFSILFTGEKLRILGRFAERSWLFTLNACIYLNLIPLEVNLSGQFTSPPRTKRLLHYTFLFCLIVLWVHRTGVTIYMATHDGLSIRTYMCASYFVLTTLSVACACGTSLRVSETLELLNLWRSLQTTFIESSGHDIWPFKRLNCSLKVAGVSLLTYMAAMNASFLSLYDDLPVCLHTLANHLGLFPNLCLIPPIIWRVIFYPLELLTLQPLMWLASLNICVIVISVEYLQLFLEHMRTSPITSEVEWKSVSQLFRCLKIFNVAGMNFAKFLLPTLLLGLSAAVIVLLYVTFRPSGLPIFIYIWFPIVAVASMLCEYWLFYDAVSAKRTSEEVHRNLLERCFTMESTQLELLKTARAMRPLELEIGEYAQVSLQAYIGICDEIINQLLFLLTL